MSIIRNGKVMKLRKNNANVVLNNSTLKGFQTIVSVYSHDQTPIMGEYNDFEYVETSKDKKDGFREFSKVKLLDPKLLTQINNDPKLEFDVEEGDVQITTSNKIDLQLREVEMKIKEKPNCIAITNVLKNKIPYVKTKIVI